MLVITYLLRRRPDLSAEEFHRYWRDEHGPLVTRHAETLGIAWYTQLHTDDSPLGDLIRASRDCADEHYDGVALLAFPDTDTLAARAGSPEGLAAAAELLEDEQRFIDIDRSTIWLSDGHPVVPA